MTRQPRSGVTKRSVSYTRMVRAWLLGDSTGHRSTSRSRRLNVPRSARTPCKSTLCPNMAEARGFCAEHGSPRIPCTVPGCPRFGAGKRESYGRCAQHTRPSSSKRGYDAAWQTTRARVLAANPVCPCGERATDVDHILSRRQGGTDHESNLQSLCHPCHSSKTDQYDGGFGNKIV